MRKTLTSTLLLATACGLTVTAHAAEWTMATPYGDASFHTQNA